MITFNENKEKADCLDAAVSFAAIRLMRLYYGSLAFGGESYISPQNIFFLQYFHISLRHWASRVILGYIFLFLDISGYL